MAPPAKFKDGWWILLISRCTHVAVFNAVKTDSRYIVSSLASGTASRCFRVWRYVLIFAFISAMYISDTNGFSGVAFLLPCMHVSPTAGLAGRWFWHWWCSYICCRCCREKSMLFLASGRSHFARAFTEGVRSVCQRRLRPVLVRKFPR